MSQNHIQAQIDLIARHEEDFLARRTRSERLGDHIAAFAGSLRFVSLHLALFFLWIAWNTLPATHGHHFDPAPWTLLADVITFEAILLASFILMRQARINRRADERDHLMLQILLLTERELTAVLKINRQIARQLGLDQVADATEIRELSQHTSIEQVAETIREHLPGSED